MRRCVWAITSGCGTHLMSESPPSFPSFHGQMDHHRDPNRTSMSSAQLAGADQTRSTNAVSAYGIASFQAIAVRTFPFIALVFLVPTVCAGRVPSVHISQHLSTTIAGWCTTGMGTVLMPDASIARIREDALEVSMATFRSFAALSCIQNQQSNWGYFYICLMRDPSALPPACVRFRPPYLGAPYWLTYLRIFNSTEAMHWRAHRVETGV